MKKICALFLALALMVNTFAASFVTAPVKAPMKASEIMVPIGNTGTRISLQDLANLKVKDFEMLSGRHLRNIDKVGFKLAQRELKKSIRPDGTINNKRLTKLVDKMADGTTGFHIGGFALGFLLGLIGVIIAYVIKDEKKPNRVKWSWIGFGVAILLAILTLI